jgi:chromosomal replication initiation ATPase DnaA
MSLIEISTKYNGAARDVNVKAMNCKKIDQNIDPFVKKVANIIYKETGYYPLARVKYRGRKYVEARQLLAVFLCKYTKEILTSVGLSSGDKDHATVVHSKHAIQNRFDTEPIFRSMYKRIDKKVKNIQL